MNRIYYFTGTGNSLHIAKTIQQSIEDTELISVTDVLSTKDKIVIKGDRVGFIFPVYFARLPVVVQNFMEKVDCIQANFTFSIITGGGLFGSLLKELNKILIKKNSQLDAGYLIKMPSNHPKIAHLQKRTNNEILQVAISQMEKIKILVEHKKPNELVVSPMIIGRLITQFAFKKPYMQSQLGELDKVFSVNESCANCGKCVSYCPVKNISLDKGHVEWLHQCINCVRCYHLCPQSAIQFGSDTMERYLNPIIEIEELS